MTVRDAVAGALAKWPGIGEQDGRVIVPTHCLYPSNGVITVIVEGGVSSFRVHDDGAALDELEASSGIIANPMGIMRSATRRHGVHITDAGVIYSPVLGVNELTAAIVLVANASKEAAHRLIDGMRPRPRRNFRFELEKLLESEFGRMPVRRSSPIVGAHKPHRFDYVVIVSEQRQLLIDGVTPDSSSINAAVVAHLDVKEAKLPNVVQRIVYDDGEAWKAEDLSLLSIGAPAVPFSRAREALKRAAA